MKQYQTRGIGLQRGKSTGAKRQEAEGRARARGGLGGKAGCTKQDQFRGTGCAGIASGAAFAGKGAERMRGVREQGDAVAHSSTMADVWGAWGAAFGGKQAERRREDENRGLGRQGGSAKQH